MEPSPQRHITISPTESAVITAMQLDADLPLTKVASLSGLREHTVRRTITALRDQGAIRRVTMINWFRLGLQEDLVSVSLRSQTQAERNRFLQALVKHDAVGWIRESGGRCRYEFSVVTPSAAHVRAVLAEVLDRSGAQIGERHYSQELRWFAFKRGYLPRVIQPGKTLTFEPTAESVAVDDLDWRIIHAVTRSEVFTIRELAQRVGVPPATAEYRLKALKKKGVIVASFLDLELGRLGILQFRISLRLTRVNDAATEQLVQLGKTQPYIVSVVSLFGSWDYAMRVEVPGAEQLGDVMGALSDLFGPELCDIQVAPVFSMPKRSASAGSRGVARR